MILALFVLGACNVTNETPEETPTSAAPPPVTIGLLLSNRQNPFFAALQQGAQEAATRGGATLIVEDAQDDAQKQAEQIEALIRRPVSALLINPVNGEALQAVLGEAANAGIPVFTVDRSIDSPNIVAHIASDNVSGGEMAGSYLAEIINQKGRVVELQGILSTSAAQDRGRGFNNVITIYPNIQLVAQETANFNRAEGHDVFAGILANNDQIDAVFAQNDEMILGAIDAAKEAGRADRIVFVGFDAIDDAITALENGELSATIAQQPKEMGRLGVESAMEYLGGEDVSSFIAVDLALITR
ncbi:MAG: substrate-binding domain-containing protein [Ardenticatenales bacterium]|nr:substrate-binding domain-containing protein [Ardenticatenales bacterium]